MEINPIQVHLAINHYPIFGLLIGTVLLLVATLMKSKVLLKASMLLIVSVGLVGIPVFFSGEESEEKVEHQKGYSEHYLEEHEELGETAYQAGLILSAFALVLFLLEHISGKNFQLANWLLFLSCLIVLGIYYLTASHGGKIRHSEIRGDAISTELIQEHSD
ncbi:MAG: hypothetical protein RIE58_09165 [Vicingaceae bacterium]